MIRPRSSGFSLLELILVLLIISLLTLLVTPSLSRSLRHMELKSAAKRISAVLRTCRSDAVNQGKIYVVYLDVASNQVSVSSADKGDDQPKTEKSYPLSGDIRMEKPDVGDTLFDSSISSFEFYPNGGSNGGTATLRGADGRGYSVKVSFLTGSVRIEAAGEK